MIDKKNDFIATVLFQPDATLEDLYANNITPDNTKIESADYYKKIPQVVEAFTKDSGEFDEQAFNTYYNNNLLAYNAFSNSDFEKLVFDQFEYDKDDWTAVGKNVKDTGLEVIPMTKHFNSIGVKGFGINTESNWSNEEIAQTTNVYDPKTNTFLNWTPNDKGGLFKGLFRESLVYATYTEDGFHEVNGKKVAHQKGEWMLNKDGLPFTMLADDEEQYGRAYVTYSSLLTKEGTKLNEYDFFDSDGLDKSAVGTIAKTLVNVLPYFIPYVGPALGYAAAGFNLAKLLPVLGKSVNSMINGNNENELGKNLTWLENTMGKFSSEVSQKTKNNMWTFETLGNLVGDVSTQLFQQKAIGSIPKLFTKNPDLIHRKVGQHLALAYMAGTSSQQTYAAFKEAGASDRTAGLGTLASIVGLYSLMSQDYFRKFLFNGSFLDDTIVKGPGYAVAQETRKQMFGETEEQAAKNLFEKFVQKFSNKYQAAAEKLNTSGMSFWDAAKNEGLEEMSEEAVTDVVKGVTLALNALGVENTEPNRQLDFGFSPQDFLQRYSMAFLGGAIGGPMFELHNRWDKMLFDKMNNVTPKTDQEELVYLIQQNRDKELKSFYKKQWEKGLLGDKNLSAVDYKVVKDESGNDKIVYLSAKKGESQNDAVYNMLIQQVDYIKSVLRSEGMMLTPQDILKVYNREGKLIDDPFVTKLIGAGINTRLLQSWNTLSTDIYNVKTKLDAELEQAYAGAATDFEKKTVEKRIKEDQHIQALEEQLAALREKRDSILKVEGLADYFGEAMFVLDEDTHNVFLNLSLDNFSKIVHGASFNAFSEERQREIKAEHDAYIKNEGTKGIYKAYDIYKQLTEKWTPRLQQIAQQFVNIKANQNYQNEASIAHVHDKIYATASEINQLEALPERTAEQEEQLVNLLVEQEKLQEQLQKLLTQNIELQSLQDLYGTPFVRADLENLNGFVDIPVLVEQFYQANANTPVLNPTGKATEEQQKEKAYQIIVRQEQQRLIDESAKTLRAYYERLKSTQTVDTYNNELDFLYSQIGKFGIGLNPKDRLEVIKENILKRDPFYIDAELNGDMDILESVNDSHIMANNTTVFIKQVETLLNALGKNNDVAINAYENIIKMIEEDPYYQMLPDASKESFKQNVIMAVLPTVEGTNVIEHLKEMNEVKKEVVSNPFIEFVKEFTLDLKGTNNTLIDLIEMEERSLKGKESVRDYVIENANNARELEEANQLINFAFSLINGGGNGLNERVNQFRRDKSQPEWAVIDENTAKIMMNGANQLLEKISILQTWSLLNQSQRLREQKDIARNVAIKQISSILGNEKLLEVFKTELNVDLKDIWNGIANKYGIVISDINDKSFIAFELAKIEFETQIHKYFREMYLEKGKQQELAKKLVENFDDYLHRSQTSAFTSDKNLRMTNYDQLMYLLATIASNSEQFYNKYRKIVMDANTNFQFAPIYSQEYAVRLGYAQFLEPDLFTEILKEIQNKAKNSNDQYVQSKPIFDRIYTILGGAGTGKTTAVDFLLKLMIAEDKRGVISVGATKHQAEGLDKALRGSARVLDKEALMQAIKGDQVLKYRLNETTEHIELENPIQISDVSLWDANVKNRILVIDEITFYDEQELRLLNEYALKHNAIIIGSGDNKQNGKILNVTLENGRTGSHMSGIEDGLFITAPTLVATMRAGNLASLENVTRLESMLRHAINASIEANNDPQVAVKEIETWLKEHKGLTLDYFENPETKEISGEKIVATIDEAKQYINAFKPLVKDPKSQIAVITNDTAKYAGLDVEVISADKVQGGEYDYVVIDVNWTPFGNENKFSVLKNLYTLTQRSRKGTVIIDKGITNLLKIVSNENQNGGTIITVQESEIDNYKTFRLESLLQIPETSEEQQRRESIFSSEAFSVSPTITPSVVPPAAPAAPVTPDATPAPAAVTSPTITTPTTPTTPVTPTVATPTVATPTVTTPTPTVTQPAATSSTITVLPPPIKVTTIKPSVAPNPGKAGKQTTDFFRGKFIDKLTTYVRENKQTLISSGLFNGTSEEELQTALLSLSDYLWNTNFWTVSANIKANKWKVIEQCFVNTIQMISQIKSAEYILEPDGILYIKFTDPNIKLPIGMTNVSIATPVKLKNVKATRKWTGHRLDHTPVHVPISELNRFFGLKYSQKRSYIFMNKNTERYNFAEINPYTKLFEDENKGKTFIPILFDLSATEQEFINFMSPNQDLKTYVDYSRPGELLGAQVISTDLNEIIEFVENYRSENIPKEKLDKIFNAIFGINAPYAANAESSVKDTFAVMPNARGRIIAKDILDFYLSNNDSYSNLVFNELMKLLTTKTKDWVFKVADASDPRIPTQKYIVHWTGEVLELIDVNSEKVLNTFDIRATDGSSLWDKSKVASIVQTITDTYGVTEFTFRDDYGKGFVEFTNANKILKRLFPKSEVRETTVEKLNLYLRAKQQWQYGYYLNDIAVNKSEIWEPNMYNKNNYLIDLGEVRALSNSVFNLEYDAEQEVVSDPELQYKKEIANDILNAVKNLGLDAETLKYFESEFSNLDWSLYTIEEVLDFATEILTNRPNPDTFIYEVELIDENKINIDKHWDPYQQIQNKFGSDVKFGFSNMGSSRKIQIFSVPSPNKDSRITMFITDLNNEYSELSENTSSLFNMLMDSENITSLPEIVVKFLVETLYENPNPNVISEFMETELSEDIRSQIENYLISRLNENEC